MAPGAVSMALDGSANPVAFIERDTSLGDVDLCFRQPESLRLVDGRAPRSAKQPGRGELGSARRIWSGSNLLYVDRILVRRATGPPSAWNVDGPLPDPGVLSYVPSTPAIAFGSGGEIHMVLAGFALGVVYAYYGWLHLDGPRRSTPTPCRAACLEHRRRRRGQPAHRLSGRRPTRAPMKQVAAGPLLARVSEPLTSPGCSVR